MISQLNAVASLHDNWFGYAKQLRKSIESSYRGELPARLSLYLENDVYVYKDAKLESYIQSIVKRLLASWTGSKFHITPVIESDTRVAAYVDPLNQLHLTTGLLRKLTSEDMLAAVLAHELAHIMLNHSEGVATAEKFGEVLDHTSATAVALIGAKQMLIDGRKRTSKKIKVGANSLGLLWSDLLVPQYGRQHEREADRLGMDLLIAAGYNFGEFDDVLRNLNNAATTRSRRVAVLNGYARNVALKKGAKEMQDQNSELKKAVRGLTNKLFDSSIRSIENNSRTHDTNEERVRLVREYFDAVYDSDALPPESSLSKFESIVRSGIKNSPMQRDLDAVKGIIALADDNNKQAASHINNLDVKRSASFDYIAQHIARSSMAIASGGYKDARLQLQSVVDSQPLAPAEAYIRLARLQAYLTDFDAALKTLDLGAKRIGRDYRFIPARIYINKIAGRSQNAVVATKSCARYDGGRNRKYFENFFDVQHQRDKSYYAQCVDILGHDPIKNKAADLKAKGSNLIQGACDLMRQQGLKCSE